MKAFTKTTCTQIAQNMRKDLRYIVREDSRSCWVFTSYYGIKLNSREFKDFCDKWASYKGNTLPSPSLFVENEKLQWYPETEQWTPTEVNIDSLVTPLEVYQIVKPTPFLTDDGQARLVKTQAGDIKLINENYYQILKNIPGQLTVDAYHKYQVRDSDNQVRMVLMGMRHDTIHEDLLETVEGIQ